MKTLIFAACTAMAIPLSAQAMSNPASVFCEKMSGHSVLATVPNGSAVGLCYLPNRKIIEEWTLLRMYDGKVPSPASSASHQAP